MPSVYVLILNYLTYSETIRYVAELKRQQGISLSILVVDNCSPNNAYAALQEAFNSDPAVDLIRTHRNGGYAFGNNAGLRRLSGKPFDYLLISNNDIRLDDEQLILRLVEAYRELPSAGFAAPRMMVGGVEDRKHEAWKLPRFRDDLLASLRTLYALADLAGMTNRYRFPDRDHGARQVDCLNGSFFLGSREVFRLMGPMDENTFLYGEESIMGQKIKALGLKNYLVRSLRFHHDLGGTTRKIKSVARLQRYWLESAVYYQKTYNGMGPAGAAMLRFLYWCWTAETRIWHLFIGQKNKTRRQHLTPGLSAYTKEKKV